MVNAEGSCQRAASVIPVEEIFEYIIIPIFDVLKRRKLEQFKVIIVRELDKLKLDPSFTWNEIEQYLAAPAAYMDIVSKPIEDVYHLDELDYCKLLHIAKQDFYNKQEILDQFEKQTEDIKLILESATKKSDKDYYGELLKDYEDARDALLKRCSPDPVITSTSTEDTDKLKERIKALIMINDGCVPEEQLEKILNEQ